MHRFTYILASSLLTVILMAGCISSNPSNKSNTPVEGAKQARLLLTFEQQRAFDKAYFEAVCQNLKGNPDAAFELFNYALTINPDAPEALYGLGTLQTSLIDRADSLLVRQGENMLQKAVTLEPSNRYFRQAMAERWRDTGQYDRATQLYEQIAADKPDAESLAILARLYELRNIPDSALHAIARIEQLEGANEQTAISKYRLLVNMGKKEEAYAVIETLCNENPHNLDYRVLRGDVYYNDGDKEKALAIYKEIREIEPDNQSLKSSLINYYFQAGNLDEFDREMTEAMLNPRFDTSAKFSLLKEYALESLQRTEEFQQRIYDHFTEALSLSQDSPIIAQFCLAFLKASSLPDSHKIAPLTAILRDEPENMEARLLVLQQYIRQNKTENIISLCHEGRTLHPDALIFYYYEGMALFQCDRNEECIQTFKQGTEHVVDSIDSDIASDLYAFLGDIYHRQNKNADAYAAYDSALRIKPDNIGCLNNYAYFLSLDRKQLDKALEMSKRAVDSEPSNPTYLDTYAWILYELKQYTQARIYIDETLKNLPADEIEAPSSASLYDHAGDIYFRCGDQVKAEEHWNHALKISEDNELNSKILKKLKTKKL